MNYRGLSLRDLEYVVAVADHAHFGQAAQACHVSQPSLSAGVRKVEEAMGLRIFERSSRLVLTTADGRAAVERAREVLAAADRMFDTATPDADPLSGPLSLGAIATIGPYLFPHVLAPLRAAHGELALAVEEGLTDGLVRRLREGVLDGVVLSPPIDDHGLVLVPLYREPLRLVVPSGSEFATAEKVELSALNPADAVLLEDGHCLRDQALSFCASASQRPRHTGMSLETLKAIVAATGGFSLIPASAVSGEGEFGGLLAYPPIDDPKVGRTVALAYRRSRDPATDMQALADLIRDHRPPGTTAIAS